MSPDLEVKVGACHVPGMPAQADDLAVSDILPGADMDGREMGVYGEDVTGMLQPDDPPVATLSSGESNSAPGHCSDLRPIGQLEIHAPVKVQREPPGPKAERGGEWGVGGPAGGCTAGEEGEP